MNDKAITTETNENGRTTYSVNIGGLTKEEAEKYLRSAADRLKVESAPTTGGPTLLTE